MIKGAPRVLRSAPPVRRGALLRRSLASPLPREGGPSCLAVPPSTSAQRFVKTIAKGNERRGADDGGNDHITSRSQRIARHRDQPAHDQRGESAVERTWVGNNSA